MEFLDLKTLKSVLIICENAQKESFNDVKDSVAKIIKSPDEINDLPGTFDGVLIELPNAQVTEQLVKDVLKLTINGATVVITNAAKDSNVEFLLKTTGFTNVQTKDDNHLVAMKPNYDIGSFKKLNLRKPTVWKLDDDDDEESIDPDNLLDEDDFKKPDPASLRVCGTTGKRKACKDCSCGLAEELANEGAVPETKDVKSSCGSCYLGDAFRCAACPYLGMPAFKPGEKVQLGGNLLKADI